MKRMLIALVLLNVLWLALRDARTEALVILTDDDYSASVIGTNKNGFAAPDGIAWSKGRFFLADEGGSALESWSESGATITLCDARAGIVSPEDIVIDASDNLYFTDDDAGGLWQIDARGNTRQLAGKDSGLASTEGIALAADGTILVGDGSSHEVLSVSKEGKVSVFLGPEYGITKPESLAFDEKGNLYIADNADDVIYLLDAKRALHKLIDGKKEALSPETIFYSGGSIYITDGRDGKLARFNPDEGLKTIALFRGKLKNIQGIAVDSQGNIYISAQSDLKNKIGYIIKLAIAAR